MFQNPQSTLAANAKDALSKLNVSKVIIAILRWMNAARHSTFRREKKNCEKKIWNGYSVSMAHSFGSTVPFRQKALSQS